MAAMRTTSQSTGSHSQDLILALATPTATLYTLSLPQDSWLPGQCPYLIVLNKRVSQRSLVLVCHLLPVLLRRGHVWMLQWW